MNLGVNNFHLTALSPAVGAGENFLALAATDFEGNKRSLPVDNGAFAYTSSSNSTNPAIFLLLMQ